MRIAQIAPPWITVPPKNYGGTEIVISYLVEEQMKQGHKVTLFAPEDAKTSAEHISFFPQSLIPSGVPWHAPLKAIYHIYKSIEYIKSNNKSFDIVHAHISAPSDILLFPFMASLSTPHLATLHGNFPFDIFQEWSGDADRLYMDWAPFTPIVAISSSLQAGVPYHLNFMQVVHHGIPMEKFVPILGKREDFFVWLGRFIPEKGPHNAIKAAKRANVPLILAGIVDKDIEKAVVYFKDLVEPLIDNRQIKYIGPVNMDQKIELLSRARGFLNPIEWEEPFGMTMIEAMALGCPVIAFARGAAPELIIHGKTGFLVQSMEEMSDFIPQIDQIDRKAVRAHVENNFSASSMCLNYLNVYQKLLK